MITKYGCIFILNQQTLPCVSPSRPFIRTIEKKSQFTLAWMICTIVENQKQKLRHLSELKENLEKIGYPVEITINGIKKAVEIPQNKLRKAKEKQANKVLPFIEIAYLYTTQIIIPLKSFREIMFQDLKTSNILTVSDNHQTLRNS